MVIPVILTQHAEQAAFLWVLHSYAVHLPHYSLVELVRLDSRIEAHLDGLRVAGDAGWAICLEAIERGDAEEIFAAAVLALESGNVEWIHRTVSAGTTQIRVSRGLISALSWLPYEVAQQYIRSLLAAQSPIARRAGIAAAANHRQFPPRALTEALADSSSLVKARALRAVCELAAHDLLPAARRALGSSNPRIQFAAAWAVARLTPDEWAVQVLRSSVESHSPDGSRALQLVLRRMEVNQASEWLNTLTLDPAFARQVVIGTGIIGVPESISWLLQMMAVPALARVAGEAFTMITGADLAAEKLEGKWPDGFAAGPTEDPNDDNVAMDEDQHLPWPDAAKLTALWAERQGDFQPGTRYFCGKPLTQEWLEHVLRHGYQRQRAAAALELAIRNPDQPLFNVRAPAYRQQQLLGLE